MDAVEIEKEFIIDSIPCKLIGMNSELMSEYIEFVANRLSVQLVCSKIYNAKNMEILYSKTQSTPDFSIYELKVVRSLFLEITSNTLLDKVILEKKSKLQMIRYILILVIFFKLKNPLSILSL